MDKQVSSNELISNIRKTLIQSLELIGSRFLQLKYQKDVPNADVSAELFCQWEDNYSPDGELFRSAFTDAELKTLAEFDTVFNEVCDELPDELPPLVELMKTPQWKRYSQAAEWTLAKLEKNP